MHGPLNVEIAQYYNTISKHIPYRLSLLKVRCVRLCIAYIRHMRDLGLCSIVNEIFVLLGRCVSLTGSWLPLFWDKLSIPSSKVQQSRTLEVGTDSFVTSQISEDF